MPILKIVAGFSVLLAMIRFKVWLWISILTGSVVIGLLFGQSLPEWFGTAVAAMSDTRTLILSLIVVLIMLFSNIQERTGQGLKLMKSLSGYLKNPQMRLVFFPALIGLLPMPGGAVFSAPMVRDASEGMNVTPTTLAMINYWYRHLWEPCWPMYPGVIMACSLSGVSIYTFLAYLWPISVVTLALGWFFFLRPHLKEIQIRENVAQSADTSLSQVFVHGLPLMVAIVGSLGLEAILSATWHDGLPELGIAAALFAAIVACVVQNKGSAKHVFRILSQRSVWNILLAVAAIFIFKDILANCGAVEELSRMAGSSAALITAALVIPFLTGFVSGITMAYVGASFPLLLGLIHDLGLAHQTMAYVVLAVGAGFCGVMSSPIHLCFVLSCEFFGVDVVKVWKQLLVPSLLVMAAGAVYWFLLL